jgi:hypothetical protein
MVMCKSNQKPIYWHHRVPDFKLVYCGPKKNIKIKTENTHKK